LDLAEFSLQTMIAELMILYFPMAQSAMCDPVQIGYRLYACSPVKENQVNAMVWDCQA
jgi:hypothetical protein